MTVADARVKVTLPDHPKTKKLIRKCGQAGAWNLIRLFLFAAANRPDGDLSGMDADDLEIAADWQGEPGAFVVALVDVRFLSGAEGQYVIHDWAEHNPWASGSGARAEKSRWAALCKQHGRQKAAEMMPEYAESLRPASEPDATRVPDSASGTPLARSGSAPSPSPLPIQDQKRMSSDKPPTDIDARLAQVTDEAMGAYNRLCAEPLGLAKAMPVGMDKKRGYVRRSLKTIREVCREAYGVERVEPQFWSDYFTTQAASDFIAGRTGRTGAHANWKPDFEYLTRPDVIAKAFERAAA
jgi:hypothetical protein